MNTLSLTLLLAVLAGIFTERTAFASEGSGLQELFLGQAAKAQEQYELQVSSRPRWRAKGHQPGSELPMEVELGLTDRLQLELESALMFSELFSLTYVSAGAGLSYAVIADAPLLLSAGLGVEVQGLRTSAGDRTFGVEPRIMLAHAVGRAHFNLTLGLELERAFDGGELELSETAVASVFVELGSVFPIAEVGVLSNEEGLTWLMAPGLAWAPSDGFEIGVAVPVEATSESLEAGVMSTLTLEWELGSNDQGDEE